MTHEVSVQEKLPAWLTKFTFVILAIIAIELPFHGFLSTYSTALVGHGDVIKALRDILLIAIAVLLSSYVITHGDLRQAVLRDWFVRIASVYLLWVAAILVFHNSGQTRAESAGALLDTRYVLMGLVAYVYGRYAVIDWAHVVRRAQRPLIIIGCFLAVSGALQVFVLPKDFLAPFGYVKDQTIAPYVAVKPGSHLLRAFSTLRGPNEYGGFMLLLIGLITMAQMRTRHKVVLLAVFAGGLILSASRSAILGLIALVVVYFSLRFGRRVLVSRRSLAISLSLVVLLIGGIFASSTVPAIRLALFHSDNSDTTLVEGSTAQHFTASQAGLEGVVRQPLGCGLGCNGPASRQSNHPQISEDYYIQIAAELGIAGLVLWLVLQVVVLYRLYKARNVVPLSGALIAIYAGIAVMAAMLHIWTDDALSIGWWLLAGLVLGLASAHYEAGGTNAK